MIVSKTFSFAIKIINIYKELVDNQKEYVLSKQLLRSGTSIGANVNEGVCSISKNDFRYKLSTAYKEAKETEYWLKLLVATHYLNKKEAAALQRDCHEICLILSSILRKCYPARNSEIN